MVYFFVEFESCVGCVLVWCYGGEGVFVLFEVDVGVVC